MLHKKIVGQRTRKNHFIRKRGGKESAKGDKIEQKKKRERKIN